MKKTFFLVFFGFAAVSVAQQPKTPPKSDDNETWASRQKREAGKESIDNSQQ